MSGDGSLRQRVLRVAEEADSCTVDKKEKAGGFGQGMLLGEPEKIRFAADTGGITEIRDQSRAFSDSAVDAGSRAQSYRATEVQAANYRFQRDNGITQLIERHQAGRMSDGKVNGWRHYVSADERRQMVLPGNVAG